MLASALWVLTPGVALAAGNAPCNVLDPNEHTGGHLEVTAVGMEAKIENQSPALCTGGNLGYSGSFAYVSVEVAGGTLSIIQVGIGRCVAPTYWTMCTGGMRYWYAWGRDAGTGSCASDHPPGPIDLGPATSGTHRFTVYRTNTTVFFQIDGTTKATIGYGNISCWTVDQDYVTIVTETLDHGDQAGGIVGDHLKTTNAVYEGSVNGVWSSPSFTSCFTEFLDYDCSRINGQAVDIWTDRS